MKSIPSRATCPVLSTIHSAPKTIRELAYLLFYWWFSPNLRRFKWISSCRQCWCTIYCLCTSIWYHLYDYGIWYHLYDYAIWYHLYDYAIWYHHYDYMGYGTISMTMGYAGTISMTMQYGTISMTMWYGTISVTMWNGTISMTMRYGTIELWQCDSHLRTCLHDAGIKSVRCEMQPNMNLCMLKVIMLRWKTLRYIVRCCKVVTLCWKTLL